MSNITVEATPLAADAVTAFPTRSGSFPPVTFFSMGDAIRYAMSFAPMHAASTCPALSFVKYHGSRAHV